MDTPAPAAACRLHSPTLSAASSALEVRLAARSGQLTGHTSGLAAGRVQGNLVILPSDMAADFLRYCERNPKPCPVLAVTEPGHPHLPGLGADLDIRCDLPRYRVWRHGELCDEPTNVSPLWQDNMIGVVLGCSFSFEDALMAEGIALRHVQQGRNVAMYRSNIPTAAVGPFQGPMVVSMRPMTPLEARRAVEITSRMPTVHGAPVHLGDPGQIGIEDLSKPDFGDAVELREDEIPVFWACGVTPQAALAAARVPLCITHAPGCMLVTDLLNSELRTP